jgi:hypothetical protein
MAAELVGSDGCEGPKAARLLDFFLMRTTTWLVVLSVLISVPTAFADETKLVHGTLIAMEVSQGRVVIAADSRGGKAPDNSCKMGILSKRILFVEAGIAAQHSEVKELGWNMMGLARSVVAKASAQPKLQDIATTWARQAQQKFSQGIHLNPDFYRSFNNTLLDSAFMALDSAGEIEVQEVSLTISPKLEVLVRHIPWTLPAEFELHALGHSEIAAEFAALASERARIEQDRWKMHLRSAFNMDYQAELVKHLVLMTEKYAPHDWGVGGPVDIAEIAKHSGPRWIVRKPECH